jgi:hypothetical protein
MIDFRFTHMPYCIKKLPSGNYIALNKDYKPLGFPKKWVDYEETGTTFKLPGLTEALAIDISYDGRGFRYSPLDHTECLWLYNDGCIPTNSKANMDKYLQRLGLLLKLRVEAPSINASSLAARGYQA